jgi:hypothetical protein
MDEPHESLRDEALEVLPTCRSKQLPIPQWQMDELDRREQEDDAATIPWSEVKRLIRGGGGD